MLLAYSLLGSNRHSKTKIDMYLLVGRDDRVITAGAREGPPGKGGPKLLARSKIISTGGHFAGASGTKRFAGSRFETIDELSRARMVFFIASTAD